MQRALNKIRRGLEFFPVYREATHATSPGLHVWHSPQGSRNSFASDTGEKAACKSDLFAADWWHLTAYEKC